MRRYIIIAIAIMAAILVMSLVKMIQARRAKARGEIPTRLPGSISRISSGRLSGWRCSLPAPYFSKAEHPARGRLMSRRH